MTAKSATSPAPGVWTLLAATHDRQTGQLTLFVNGVAETVVDGVQERASEADLVIARGAYGGWFKGDLAEVRVWDRVAFSSEFTNEMLTLTGSWSLDFDTEDSSAYGRPFEVAGTVSYEEDFSSLRYFFARLESGAVLTTNAPAVRTDQSYSAMAFAKPIESSNEDAQTVLSQVTSIGDGFKISYQSGTWRLVADGTELVADADGTEWAHLAAVYDAQAGQLRLYVNGQLRASAEHRSMSHADGPFQVGPWTGAIDEVRVFQGVASDSIIEYQATN